MTKIKISCLDCKEEKIFDMTKLGDIQNMIRFFQHHNIKRKVTILDNGKSQIYKMRHY